MEGEDKFVVTIDDICKSASMRKDGVVRRLKSLGTENIDFKAFKRASTRGGGRPKEEYFLTEEMAIALRNHFKVQKRNVQDLKNDNMLIIRKQPIEIVTMDIIAASFGDYSSLRQFQCGEYRIDLYFPDLKLAIECDEGCHRNYDRTLELARQKFLESLLGCRFVRFNPDDQQFNIGHVILHIRNILKAS